MTTPRLATLALLATSLPLTMCGGSGSTTAPTTTVITSTTPTTGTSATLPAIYAKFGNGVKVSLDGTTVVLTTTDVPDHTSPYFGVGRAGYEAPQAGMAVNPNLIASQNITFRVPSTPARGSASDTPLGPIGVATNGVVFFNQYAAGRTPLTSEILSFDRYNGHPSPSNQYHYHVEPLWLTAQGKSVFLGVLLDGFPVYGTQDTGGATPTDLDSCNGHTGATTEFRNGIYHYHVTSAPPYISGCFYGSTGTVAG